jgi:hypothetical protein
MVEASLAPSEATIATNSRRRMHGSKLRINYQNRSGSEHRGSAPERQLGGGRRPGAVQLMGGL